MNLPRKPSLWRALRLRCPYCGVEPLLQRGSWFNFRAGCPRCGYRYEREEGYYTGGSWMVNFPVTATSIFVLSWVMVVKFPQLSGLLLAAAVSALAVVLGLFIYPFCMAIWMYFEHVFHPLTSEDQWQP